MTDDEKWRRYRMQAKMMAILVNDDKKEETFERACGLCVCEHCGLEYYDHPNRDGLRLTCDGRWWKL